jgi:hypothetical protein
MERRIKIVGLCLLAAFALSAVVAVASAQATVEIGKCVKTVKGPKGFKGRYVGKDCKPGLPPEGEEASSEEIGLGGKNNKYEWEAGANGNTSYTATGTEPAKTVTILEGELEIVCKSSEATGAVRGATGEGTLEAKFDFKGCNQPKSPGGKQKCSTHGKEIGEIESKTLIAGLSENVAKEPQLAYVAKEHGTTGNAELTWAEFECKETTYKLTGTLTGKDTTETNKPGKKGGVDFVVGTGQELVAHFPNPFNNTETEEEAAKLVFAQKLKFGANYELRQSS